MISIATNGLIENLARLFIFLLALSLAMAVHELGHCLAARFFGCRIDRYFLFLDFGPRIFYRRIRRTQIGIGWFPLGAYARISGMEAIPTDTNPIQQTFAPQASVPGRSHEYYAKPAWQRLIILLSGIIANLLLGILIFIVVIHFFGEKYVPASDLPYGIATDSFSRSIGLKDGDQIKLVDGKPSKRFEDIKCRILLYGASGLTIERAGQEVPITIPKEFAERIRNASNFNFISPRIPFINVDSVTKGSPAWRSGFQKGDKILKINGNVAYVHNFAGTIAKEKPGRHELQELRGQDTILLSLTISNDKNIGLQYSDADNLIAIQVQYKGIEAVLTAGLDKGMSAIQTLGLQLWMLVSGKTSIKETVTKAESLTANNAEKLGWLLFLHYAATFTILTAVINMLPTAELDGGKILFILFEMVYGQKIPEKVIRYWRKIGLIFMILLMLHTIISVFVNGI